MNKKMCIMFAGVIGSSKTQIAYYISWNLGLSIFNNDTIRAEVSIDCNGFNEAEYERRRDERLQVIITSDKPFIYDASIDRLWGDRKKQLVNAGYDIFIISLDLSKNKLQKIYNSKWQDRDDIDKYLNDHELFLQTYSNDVNLHITDAMFSERLNISLNAVKNWMKI